MLNTLYRYQARKAEEDSELGFTLIELLIVIVVLGILAAVTVFALSGVSGTSAQAACNSDASSVNTALVAYSTNPSNSAVPATPALLTATSTPGGPYLQSFPTSSHYVIGVTGSAPGPYGVTVTGTVTAGVAWAAGTGNAACASSNVK